MFPLRNLPKTLTPNISPIAWNPNIPFVLKSAQINTLIPDKPYLYLW